MGDRGVPASLRRRAAAAGLDTVPFVIVGGVVALLVVRRDRGFKPPRSATAAVQAAKFVTVAWFLGERGATPGQRLLGLRVVDATTGENLPFRRALVRTAVPSAVSLVRLVVWPRWMEARQRQQERVRERLATVQERVRELQDQFADDPDALSDAVNSLYREHRVMAGCLKDPQIIVAVLYSLAVYVPALYSARRQALHDRLAHAAVIRTK